MSAARVPLHFAHANGFPGACYRKLFSCLAADFDVGYLPASGHDPRFPVSDGWPLLVEEGSSAGANPPCSRAPDWPPHAACICS